MALQAGEIDMIIDSGGVLPDDAAMLEGDSHIKILRRPQPMVKYLVLNCSRHPFDDPKVRRAVHYAVDQQGIVQNLLKVGRVATSLLTSDVKEWHFPAFEAVTDPAMAGKLLAEAGWTDTDNDGVLEKNGEPFSVTFLLSTQQINMGADKMISEAIQQQLRKVGIAIEIKVLEKGIYYETGRTGEDHHIMLWGYPFLGPHNVLYRSFHSSGDWNLRGGFYNNPEMDELLERGMITMDQQKRREVYYDVQKLAAKDVPIVPLYEAELINAVQKGVEGYRLHPWFVVNWQDIYRSRKANR
jgi:peptide/nickel transport system substrate-binding protein